MTKKENIQRSPPCRKWQGIDQTRIQAHSYRRVFSIIPKVRKQLKMCINIRRRSVTIREISRRKKTSLLNFTFQGKNQENLEDWKIRDFVLEIMGKKLSDKLDQEGSFLSATYI